MARVLLVYPRMKTLAPRFPYSVLPIAGTLIEAGHEATVLDTQVEDLSDIDPKRFDMVGISTYSGPQIASAIEAAAYVRRSSPDVLLVWGGVHPSITPHQTILHPLVDVVVRSEGERTLLNVIDAVEKGVSLRNVLGLTFIEDGEVVDTGNAEFIDLDSLPFLPYHLIKPDRYVHLKEKPSRVYFESSRGCPHNCGFCYNEAMHRRKWRSKSVSRVLDELEYIIDTLRVDEIWPSDDNFAVSKKRVEEIARGKIERGLGFKWVMSSRFDYSAKYDEEFLGLLKESGCDWLTFGGESGSQMILDMICKGISPEKMRETTRLLKANDIICGVNYMAGFPIETAGDLQQTFDLIDELVSIDPELKPGVSIYTPFPGTPLYPDALSHGFKNPGSLEGWGKYRFSVVDNLPWLERRRRNLIRTVGLLSGFDFTATRYRSRSILKGKRFLSLAYRLLNASARFRWKHKFFSPAPEWRLLDWGLKVFGFWER
jgi:radical SAM superfamily enzyme YgiQ (UPF0313 family)